MTDTSPPRFSISLYTGAGGLDLGLHAAGFVAAIAVECDSAAVRTLRAPENERWWDGTAIVDGRIEEEETRDAMRAALTNRGLARGDVALLAGGPPCQPFSKSGYWHRGDARRLDDPRASTLTAYFDVLEEFLPETFLLENVPGLAFSQKDDGLRYIESAIGRINRRNGTRYRLHAAQLNAVEYGVPQLRERVFVIGQRDGLRFSFPAPTHQRPQPVDMADPESIAQAEQLLQTGEGAPKPFVRAWDVLAPFIGQTDPELAPRGKWSALLPTIPEGNNYLFHTPRGGGRAIFPWRGRYWSMLLKLAKCRPSWTLTAQPGPAIGPFHWENRRLSGAELCALQTFPSGYRVLGSVLEAHRQVGNAVPSALAEHLGRAIREQLLGEGLLGTSPCLVPERRDDLPPPEPPKTRLPKAYRGMIAEHADHPGTGLGPGAIRRSSAQAR